MKPSLRLISAIFLLSLCLLAGMLFWPFILKDILTPISLVVWLLLRIFVLSIGQQYYWGALIFVILLLLLRQLPPERGLAQEENFPDSNTTIKTFEYWRSLFTLGEQDLRDSKTIKGELVRLLLSFYATRQRTAADFRLYDALQQGEIPLPEDIHAFLFPEEPPSSTGHSLKKRVQAIQKAPGIWIRRWTGQEAAEYYRMIDKVLGFMETSLEIKNDDGNTNPYKH
jgi:hypothetical protein